MSFQAIQKEDSYNVVHLALPLNCHKSECLAMYIGQSCGDRCSYGGRENPESFSGCYLIKSYENPALLITQIWRLSFVNKRSLAVNKFTTLYWRN